MRFREIITEAYDVSKARIDHPEDLVFSQGSQGAGLAIKLLQQAVQNSGSVSIKPDGKPAIMWGNDSGGFAMGDKYMKPLPHSIEELAQILNSRKGGGREDLLQMYAKLWPVFEASVPGFNGYLFGDLMYSNTPPIQNGKYMIKPNTVLYQVDANSELGKKIGNSQAGIVVHSMFPADGTRVGKHVDNLNALSGVVPDGALLLMSDSLGSAPKLTAPNFGKINSAIGQYGKEIDAFLDPAVLTQKKIKALSGLLNKYINSRVKARNFDNLANDFISYIQNESTAGMAQKISQHIAEHQKGFAAAFAIFTAIFNAKNAIINQLDSAQGTMSASIGDESGHEGYVVHSSQGPVKLVDRFKFSAANFGESINNEKNKLKESAKVVLYTDPDYYGADVSDDAGEGLPVKSIPLDKLVGFEPDDKMKAANSASNMGKMVDLIKSGKGMNLPPILVRKYKGGYQVLDGHHRFHAYKAAGAKTIPGKIIPDSDIEVKDKGPEETTNEHIVKVKGGYRLVSKKTGRNLGTYPTKAGAKKRERQVQYFKHMGEDATPDE